MRTAEPELGTFLRQREITLDTRIDSWLGDQLLADHVPFNEGAKITEDASSDVGGTLEFEVPADRVWLPQNRATHPLGDLGQRLHVTRYVVTPDQRWHPIVMGWWKIIESPVEDGSVKVKAAELWDTVADYEFTYPLVPDPSSRWAALRDVLAGMLPQPATIPAGLLEATTDLIYDEGRVAAALEIIDAMDGLARIDQTGTLEILPDPPTTVVMSFRDGVGGTIAERVPTLSDPPPNAFIVRSEPEGEDPPIQAVSVLTTGPRRWDGPYGNRPETFASPLLTTYTQCKHAADKMLAKAQSRANVVKVTCAPDPRLQIHDLVQVDWTPDSQSLTRSNVLVQSIDHPLDADVMTFTGTEIV